MCVCLMHVAVTVRRKNASQCSTNQLDESIKPCPFVQISETIRAGAMKFGDNICEYSTRIKYLSQFGHALLRPSET